jgi:uncharacterized protein YndB with AHSA1/START domain
MSSAGYAHLVSAGEVVGSSGFYHAGHRARPPRRRPLSVRDAAPEGDLFHLTGEFREVDPASRLVYTFVWEPPDPDDRETVVTLSFRDLDGSTQVDFTQGVFATEEQRALHEQGWTESFERMQELLSAP